MKSFKYLFAVAAFAAFCASSANASHLVIGEKMYCLSKERVSEAIIDDIFAIPVGAAVGALTGGVCAALDKSRPLAWVEHWILEVIARSSIISLLDYVNSDRRQDHAREIMHLTAWLGSWAAYKATL